MCFNRKVKREYIKCPLCEGKGYIFDGIWNEKCPRCSGNKKIEKPENESKSCGTCGCRLED